MHMVLQSACWDGTPNERTVDRSVLIGPEEGAHGELPLLAEVAGDGEAVLAEEAVDAPLRHRLVVRLLVPRVVQRHPERRRRRPAAAVAALLLMVAATRRRRRLAGLGMLLQGHDARTQGAHAHVWLGCYDSCARLLLPNWPMVCCNKPFSSVLGAFIEVGRRVHEVGLVGFFPPRFPSKL